MSWKNIGIRSYEQRTPKADAFVFGAYKPQCLWAWAVYYSGGRIAGVENSFRSAKVEADIAIGKYAYGDVGRDA